jgi:hypothetical protein
MGLLIVIALLSTPAFYKAAKPISSRPGLIASIPFVAACLVAVTALALDRILDAILRSTAVSIAVRYAVYFFADLFLILSYLLLISRLWHSLRSNRKPPDETTL